MRKIITGTLLDTGGGPNLYFRGHVQSTDVHINPGDDKFISYANGRSLNILGTTTLFERFGSYVVKVDFYACEKLATAYVLCGDFCNMFFNSIKPR